MLVAVSPNDPKRAPGSHSDRRHDGSPEPPIELGEPRIEPYEAAAGGVAAVTTALRHTIREAGVRRGGRALLKVNQEDGFDCPSCAWPDPKKRSFVEFCENGARAVADEATRKRVDPHFFARWSIPDLLGQSDRWLNEQGRLTHPMVRRPGSEHYTEISWDEAFELVASELSSVDDPNQAVFYTSGRTSNEAAFLYQLFVRQFGTNNMPDCSNMCHESSGTGLKDTIGVGKGTVQLEDFELADAIFVIGQNPGTNHPRMLTALREAKRRGCTIVSINPLREAGLLAFKHPQHVVDMLGPGVRISDVYLQVRIGGDIALLKGIMKIMLERERADPGSVLDRDFIVQHTSDFDDFATALDAVSWHDIDQQSGVQRCDIEAAAEIAIRSQRTICCWAMGVTQHKHGVDNVQEIVNFLLLRGNLGRPGAGACPVRGHSNVQGDRTMGVWEKLPPWSDRLAQEFSFMPPRAHGYDTVGAIEAMLAGRVNVFLALGGNFLSATPDTHRTAQGLRRCRLTAHVSTKLNRAHLITGDASLILPCLGRSERDQQAGIEQFVTVENSMSIVHASRGTLEPASQHLLSEPMIVAKLATATLAERSRVDWLGLAGNYDRIRDCIERVVPGFHHFNDRVRLPGGFVLPNSARERRFETSNGRARFTVVDLPCMNLEPGQYLMTTIRAHDQFNTCIYDRDDRYRGVYGHRRIVLMNPVDMRSSNLRDGQKVTLISHFGAEQRMASSFVVVPYELPRRCVATYFPEANVLIPLGSYAHKSRTPTSKSVVITIHPA